MEAETKICQNCKQSFTIDSNDFGFYEKIKVPLPTWCPPCRSLRRLSWRNTLNLYNRNCDLCGQNTLSMYAPDSNLVVYCVKCFWSDNWDPYKYAQDFDPKKSFFEQYMELNSKVPKMALVNDDGIGSVNSPFCNDFAFSKNCYMVFIAWKLENVMYSMLINKGREICDCLGAEEACEFMYESMIIDGCYRCRNVVYGSTLTDCDFCYDCRECADCLMCTGLRNKKYCYKNKEYSKEEYEKIMESYALHTRNGWQRAQGEFNEFILSYPRRFAALRNTVSCTGNDMTRSKHTRDSFFASFSEESRYVINGVTFKDCYDLSGGGETECCYEALTPDHSYNNFFSMQCWEDKEIAYCENCFSSSNLFGCISIKKGEYVILNKRYKKEEYLTLKDNIIEHMKKTGEWGEFFPSNFSHFGYNETEAQDLHTLSREEALARGLKWQDNIQLTTGQETINQKDIPDSITDVSESIIKEILKCESCSRNYKITENELIFYKRMNVPIPRFCFFCRNTRRVKLRNPFKLWHRSCMCEKDNHSHEAGKCEVEFETSYAPERREIIYCEKCYQAEVY